MFPTRFFLRAGGFFILALVGAWIWWHFPGGASSSEIEPEAQVEEGTFPVAPAIENLGPLSGMSGPRALPALTADLPRRESSRIGPIRVLDEGPWSYSEKIPGVLEQRLLVESLDDGQRYVETRRLAAETATGQIEPLVSSFWVADRYLVMRPDDLEAGELEGFYAAMGIPLRTLEDRERRWYLADYETPDQLSAYDLAREDLLRHSPAGVTVEPDMLFHLAAVNDPRYLEQWGLRTIGMEDVWEAFQPEGQVLISIVDSGVNLDHPDIRAALWRNPGETANGQDSNGNGWVDDIHGYDFVNDNPVPNDESLSFHGTHIAGIIGATRNNNMAIAGMLDRTQLQIVKVFGRQGSTPQSTILRGMDYSIRNGARIINASWGGPDYSAALRRALEDCLQQGIIVVTAAGNEGRNIDISPSYPAAYELPNVISVGAMNENGTPASFSNFGRRHVDIFAPGVNIVSLGRATPDYVQSGNGTSYAAPFVTGAIALAMEAGLEYSPAEWKSHVRGTANVQPVFQSRAASSGTLNAYRLVLNADVDRPMLFNPPQSMAVYLGETINVPLGSGRGGPFEYRWYRDGQRLSSFDNRTLNYPSARAEHAGNYRLVIENSQGSREYTFTIRVDSSAPFISRHLVGLTAQPGRTVVLEVEARGDRPMTYAWTRNGSPLPTIGSRLVIPSFSSSDIGEYAVTVTNPRGSAASGPVRLDSESTAAGWREVSKSPDDQLTVSLGAGDGRYFLAFSDGSYALSGDGRNWTYSALPLGDLQAVELNWDQRWLIRNIEGVWFVSARIRIGGVLQVVVFRSTDGFTWDRFEIESLVGMHDIFGGAGVIYGETGSHNPYYYLSRDGGLSFEKIEKTSDQQRQEKIVYAQGAFWTLMPTGEFFRSSDTIDWSLFMQLDPNEGNPYETPVEFGDYWFVGGYWFVARFWGIFYSSDLVSWRKADQKIRNHFEYVFVDGQIQFFSSMFARYGGRFRFNPESNEVTLIDDIPGPFYSNNPGVILDSENFIVMGGSFRMRYRNASGELQDVTMGTFPQIREIAYGNGRFIGNSYGQLYFSNNGVDWQSIGTIPIGYQIRSLSFRKDLGLFYALGIRDHHDELSFFATSKDGYSWKYVFPNVYLVANIVRRHGFAYWSYSQFVGSKIEGPFHYSLDGLNWVESEIDYTGGIASNGEVVVAVTDSGIYSATEPGNWVKRNLPLMTGNEFYTNHSIVYENGRFVLVLTNAVYISTDGISWEWHEMPKHRGQSITQLTAAAGTIYGRANHLGAFSSTDGVNWKLLPEGFHPYHVAGNRDALIAMNRRDYYDGGGAQIFRKVRDDAESGRTGLLHVEPAPGLPRNVPIFQEIKLGVTINGPIEMVQKVEYLIDGTVVAEGLPENNFQARWTPERLGVASLQLRVVNSADLPVQSNLIGIAVDLGDWIDLKPPEDPHYPLRHFRNVIEGENRYLLEFSGGLVVLHNQEFIRSQPPVQLSGFFFHDGFFRAFTGYSGDGEVLYDEYRSADGLNWEKGETGMKEPLTPGFQFKGRYYRRLDWPGDILVSDNQRDWEIFLPGVEAGGRFHFQLHTDGSYLYIITNDGLERSDDGKNWTQVEFGAAFTGYSKGIVATPNALYSQPDFHNVDELLWVSKDHGDTWEMLRMEIPLGIRGSSLKNITAFEGFTLLGYDDGVYLTTDDRSFAKISRDLRGDADAFFVTGDLLVAAYHSGILKAIPLFDLAASGLTTPETDPADSARSLVRYTVTNSGLVPLTADTPIQVVFHFSSDDIWGNDDDRFVHEETLELNLDPGESIRIETTIPNPATMTLQQAWNLGVFVNADLSLFESNYDNNFSFESSEGFRFDWYNLNARIIQGWRKIEGFGALYAGEMPWFYHPTLGWMYSPSLNRDNLWFYLPNHGWMWTGLNRFPYAYFIPWGTWVRFHFAEDGAVWAFRFDEERWERWSSH